MHESHSRIQRKRQQKASNVTSMDLHKCWKVTWAVVSFIIIFLNPLEASETYDHESLEALVGDRANREIPQPRTGTLYDIPLPSNFSGIKFSVIRVRSGSLRLRGLELKLNSSFFDLPPRIKPEPNVKRIAIVCENLGNWSSHYYNVPNYTIISPVLGLTAYNSSGTTLVLDKRIKLSSLGEDKIIKVRFFRGGVDGKLEKVPICAKFGGDGGFVELKNMSEPYVCETKSEGHYGLVVPLMEEGNEKVERKRYYESKRWVLGFGIGSGVIGLVLVGLGFVGTVKVVKRKKMREMEEMSEKGEAIDVFWVGGSKMPSASMIRTQPVLEN